jgi:uncharacterized FlaG/YvyC family protein
MIVSIMLAIFGGLAFFIFYIILYKLVYKKSHADKKEGYIKLVIKYGLINSFFISAILWSIFTSISSSSDSLKTSATVALTLAVAFMVPIIQEFVETANNFPKKNDEVQTEKHIKDLQELMNKVDRLLNMGISLDELIADVKEIKNKLHKIEKNINVSYDSTIKDNIDSTEVMNQKDSSPHLVK